MSKYFENIPMVLLPFDKINFTFSYARRIAVIPYTRNKYGHLKFLLVRNNGCYYTSVGGGIESTDFNLFHTLQREMKEEVGAYLEDFKFMWECSYAFFEMTAGMIIFVEVKRPRLEPVFVPNDEISELVWLSEHDINYIMNNDSRITNVNYSTRFYFHNYLKFKNCDKKNIVVHGHCNDKLMRLISSDDDTQNMPFNRAPIVDVSDEIKSFDNFVHNGWAFVEVLVEIKDNVVAIIDDYGQLYGGTVEELKAILSSCVYKQYKICTSNDYVYVLFKERGFKTYKIKNDFEANCSVVEIVKNMFRASANYGYTVAKPNKIETIFEVFCSYCRKNIDDTNPRVHELKKVLTNFSKSNNLIEHYYGNLDSDLNASRKYVKSRSDQGPWQRRNY